MKAILKLELFSEVQRQQAKINRSIFNMFGEADYFDKTMGVPPRSSWVAEITGPDEKYRLARNFLKPKLDYSHSNGVGSRGIFAEFILTSGAVYEVKSQVTWQRVERYYCYVDDEGDIIHITDEDVCLAVGAMTQEEWREHWRGKKLS